MSFKVLQEMVDLHELGGGGLVSAFKKGYNDARSKVEKVKISTQVLADDMNQYIDDFFTKFPNYGGDHGSEDLLQKYDSDESRKEIIKAYKTLATRVEALRQGFNKSIVAAGKVPAKTIKKYDQQAKQMMGADAPDLPAPLIRFVKKEATFFKRLIKINGNAELNESDFKELLALKIKQTDSGRVPDAAQALNLLFGYAVAEFNGHVRTVETAQHEKDEQARKDRIASRNQPDDEPAAT